jgi:prepilin-type N-terminal cleavage/methylation domain-containing protein
MKKAFTLIELLVVIAIIAILAAILFPVFAQAKSAAKKTQALSNNKQVGLAVLQYMADYDDTYPRNDDCQPNSSLNPANRNLPFNPAGVGCTSAPFYNRMNHYSWHKWVLPYTKNIDMYFHPVFGRANPATGSCPGGQWSDCGQVMWSYGINLGLTGALNTYGPVPITRNGAFRNSFLGGTQTAVPDVAGAMLLVELVNNDINFAPQFLDSSSGTVERTGYPFAVQEAWRPYFFRTDFSTCASTNVPDNARVPFANNINIGYADGHSKALSVGAFMGLTPTAAQYGISSRPACGLGSGSWTISSRPVWTQPWPFWGLS